MRRVIAPLLTVIMVLSIACEQDDDGNVIEVGPEDLTPDATVVVRTAAVPTAVSSAPTIGREGEAAEVQGIIGAIDRDEGVIVINPLRGTSIDRVRVGPDTEIRSAGGGTITLADLRVSDRIIARGRVDEGEFVADEIEISQAAPGSDPGG